MASSALIDDLERQFGENPRRIFARLANEYRKAGEPERAIEICRAQVPLQPTYISGYIVLGQALFDSAQLEEARQTFETALQLDPENLIALRQLGDIARGLGDAEAARLWYQRLLEVDPQNDEVMAHLDALAPSGPPERDASADGRSYAPVTWQDINPEVTRAAAPTNADERAAVGEAAAASGESADGDESGMLDLEEFVTAAPPAPPAPPAPAAPSLAGTEGSNAGAAAEPVSGEIDATGDAPLTDDGAGSGHHDAVGDDEPLDLELLDGFVSGSAVAFSAPFPAAEEAPASPESPDIARHVAAPEDEYDVLEYPSAAELGTLHDDAGGLDAEAEPASDAGAVASSLEGESGAPVTLPAPELEPESPAPAAEEDDDFAVAAGHDPMPDAGAAFVTETMAELYLQQGHQDEAVGIYRQLVARSPDDAALRERLAAIDPMAQAAPRPAQSVRAFLGAFAARRSVGVGSPHASSNQSDVGRGVNGVSSLFGAKSNGHDDGAAALLAAAFSRATDGHAADGAAASAPPRPAGDALSLDAVFRPGARTSDGSPPAARGAVSFDEFFAPDGGAPSGTHASAPADAGVDAPASDLALFHAWLDGLKK